MNNKIILRLRFLIFLYTLLSMSACQQKQNLDASPRSLRLNFLNGDPPCLHPHFFAGHTRCECLGKLLFECLTRSDAKGEIQLTGAKSFTLSPDGMQYVFILRESHWSDGSLVTAFQYESAWKEGMQPTSVSPRSDLFYVIKNAREIKKGDLPLSAAGVKALDEHTLLVELAFPLPVFLQFLSHPVFAPLQHPQGDPTQYNGAFVVDKWTKGVGLNLKKNPHFWNREQVSLDTIEISFVSDAMTASQLYQKGEIDWLGEPICPMQDEVAHALAEQETLRKMYSSRFLCLPLNITCFPLDSVPIRRALSLALDREAINQYILVGKPLYSPLPLALSLNRSPTGQNIGLAQELFQQGLQENNLTLKTFPVLTLRFCNVPGMKELAVYARETWQKVLDITVQLQSSDWNTLRSALTKGDFQIGCFYDKPYYLDPLNVLERFEFINASNPSRWTHSLFQEKIALARMCTDPQKRNQWIQELEEILIEEAPVIPVSNQIQLYAHHPNLTGYVFDDAGYVDFSFARISPSH
jgi:oligopeptide transport system substrate-binding protein